MFATVPDPSTARLHAGRRPGARRLFPVFADRVRRPRSQAWMERVTSRYDEVRAELRARPLRWLVTGAAGFIGSNLTEALLLLGQRVRGLDNFSTGRQRNLDDVRASVGDAWENLEFRRADITDLDDCRAACEGVDVVLHQAALGSVPRSIADPLANNRANVDGFLNMLVAARDAGVRRFVYAASSSTYGDHPGLPKVEDQIGRPLSPYAVSKYVNELYAGVFQRTYGLQVIGLRYFNVFGRRQDPDGAYAAVIPAWIGTLLAGGRCAINGDGETSRDFCFVENVVQANLLAALTAEENTDEVFNIAVGGRTTLNELFTAIRDGLAPGHPELADAAPEYRDFRFGDVRHSQADVSKARARLGYEPTHTVQQGLAEALPWYVQDLTAAGAR
jgi:UDP-N-acetylglucosamine/UDP-N-acetylgalactosamine 4-epimerase